MNSLCNDQAGSCALAGLNYERRDLRCRDIVEHALAVQAASNTMSAVEYLKSHDVGADVIARVLLDRAHRRSGAAH